MVDGCWSKLGNIVPGVLQCSSLVPYSSLCIPQIFFFKYRGISLSVLAPVASRIRIQSMFALVRVVGVVTCRPTRNSSPLHKA